MDEAAHPPRFHTHARALTTSPPHLPGRSPPQVCDCVSELAAGIIERGEWPELLPFMFQCVQSGQERLMEAALLIFEDLARYVMPQLAQQLGTLHEVLHSCLGHPSMDVKLAAFRATCMFIRALDSPADRDRFQSALPLMLAVVGAALNAADELAAQTAVELLIEVADEHPRFLRRRLPEVADAMLQIAGTESLDEGTRRLAAEFLVTLCEAREKAPGMMRKLPQVGGWSVGVARCGLTRGSRIDVEGTAVRCAFIQPV